MKKVLLVVAHPDDETIWSGGLILQNPSWNWTIFSLCRASDADRAPKFIKVCSTLGAKPIISDLDDETDESIPIAEIKFLIFEKLKDRSYDLILTHGKNGEYGHIRHREIHDVITRLVKENSLQCSELLYFDYIAGKEKSLHDPDLKIPIANKSSDVKIALSAQEYEKKLRLITDVYGFAPPIFETMAAGQYESFARAKLN